MGAGTRVYRGIGTQVYRDTGKSVTARLFQEEKRRYRDLANDHKAFLPPSDCHAYPLIKLLHTQSQKVIRSVFDENKDALDKAAHNMPVSTNREKDQRSCIITLIGRLMVHSQMYYKTSEKPVRVSAVDTTIHLLPREFRKIALTGCHSPDLKSAQLALAARYWEIPALTDFLKDALRSDTSCWDEILTHLKLSPVGKGAIKRATYSMLFGKSLDNLLSALKKELRRDEALSAKQVGEAAKGFFKHPLVAAILESRALKMKEVLSQGGLENAFGKFMSVSSQKQASSLT